MRARCSPHHVFRAVRQALSQVAVNVHLGQPARKKDGHSVTHGEGTPGQGLCGAFTPFPGAHNCTKAWLAERHPDGSPWLVGNEAGPTPTRKGPSRPFKGSECTLDRHHQETLSGSLRLGAPLPSEPPGHFGTCSA